MKQLWTIEEISIFSNSSHLEWRAELSIRHILLKDNIQIFFSETAEPNSTRFSWDSPWVVPFQICVRQLRSPFQMAAVTKNRNFFNCPQLLHYKLK
jgi:hypothetical protein